MKYQYHLIAQSDDLAHFTTRNIVAHSDPLFASFCLETEGAVLAQVLHCLQLGNFQYYIEQLILLKKLNRVEKKIQ